MKRCAAVVFFGLLATALVAQEIPLGERPKDELAIHATRGHCGIATVDVSLVKEIMKEKDPQFVRNLTISKGAYVIDVMPGSSAEASGLKSGHVITHVDGTIVESSQHLRQILAIAKPGESVKAKARYPVSRGRRIVWTTVNGDLNPISYFQNCVNACDIEHDQIADIRKCKHQSSMNSRADYVEFHISQWGKDRMSKLGEVAKSVLHPTSLRLVANYAGRDWIFLKQISVVSPSGRVEWTVARSSVDSDAHGGWVSETVSVPVAQDDIATLRAMLKSPDDITVRLRGDQLYQDVEVTERMRHRMITVFDLFAMNQGHGIVADLSITDPFLTKRVFVDSSGTFRISAVVSELTDDSVTLLKSDKDSVTVPLAKLSQDDQDWLARAVVLREAMNR